MFPHNKSKRVGVQGDVPFLIINGVNGVTLTFRFPKICRYATARAFTWETNVTFTHGLWTKNSWGVEKTANSCQRLPSQSTPARIFFLTVFSTGSTESLSNFPTPLLCFVNVKVSSSTPIPNMFWKESIYIYTKKKKHGFKGHLSVQKSRKNSSSINAMSCQIGKAESLKTKLVGGLVSTHLKNMLVKLGSSSPRDRDEKHKNIWVAITQ